MDSIINLITTKNNWEKWLVECPCDTRASPVVAAREIGRWPVVPVAVKLKSPPQITNDLNGISRIRTKTDPARIGEGWGKVGGDVQIRLLEDEDLNIPRDEPRCNALKTLRAAAVRLIVRALISKSAQHRDARSIRVFEKAPNATASTGLELDSLLGTLKETSEPGIKPVVPA